MDSQKSDTAYRVLARKYRPQNFDDLIGQEPMVRTLTNAFDMNRIAQAWMLTGVRGVGKTTTARILARALNYKTDTIDRPTIHMPVLGEHCRAIMEGRHVDVVEMDAASHTGIDDIREIIEQIRYRPVSARYKVYIIDEVHMLSNQAFNGLLKTLEEPPPHAKFIFATTEIRKVPVTVLSRCQRFDLRRVDAAVLTQHLQKISAAEQIEAEPEALAMIARAGEGSVRDCLSMLDQAIAHSGIDGGEAIITAAAVRDQLGLADKSQIISLFGQIMAGQPAQALAQIQRLYEYGADLVLIIRELLEFNHFVTRLKFQPDMADDLSLSEDERREGAAFAAKISVRVLSRSWQMLLKGLSEAENAARPLAAAEMLLVRLCHAADLPNLDDALRFLEQQKSGAAPAIAIVRPAAAELPAPERASAAAEAEAAKAAEAAERKPTAQTAGMTDKTEAPAAAGEAAAKAMAGITPAPKAEAEAPQTAEPAAPPRMKAEAEIKAEPTAAAAKPAPAAEPVPAAEAAPAVAASAPAEPLPAAEIASGGMEASAAETAAAKVAVPAFAAAAKSAPAAAESEEARRIAAATVSVPAAPTGEAASEAAPVQNALAPAAELSSETFAEASAPAAAEASGGSSAEAAGEPVKKNAEFSLKQLAVMAGEAGKLQLQFYLNETIRPVLLRPPQQSESGHRPGLVRFCPLAAAPADIERQIAALLQETTGERWQVEAVAEGGGKTLQEEAAEHRQALFADARKNADVQAVLKIFPQAKLVDVRLKNTDIFLSAAEADIELDSGEAEEALGED